MRLQFISLKSKFQSYFPEFIKKTTNNIEELTQQARENIRPHFFNADMGITGANFLISDSGSTVIVTNEGNGRMTNTLPKVHVAVTSIEKCISILKNYL